MATADWWRIPIAGIQKLVLTRSWGSGYCKSDWWPQSTIQDPNLNMHSETGPFASIPAAYLLCRRHHSKDRVDGVQRIRWRGKGRWRSTWRNRPRSWDGNIGIDVQEYQQNATWWDVSELLPVKLSQNKLARLSSPVAIDLTPFLRQLRLLLHFLIVCELNNQSSSPENIRENMTCRICSMMSWNITTAQRREVCNDNYGRGEPGHGRAHLFVHGVPWVSSKFWGPQMDSISIRNGFDSQDGERLWKLQGSKESRMWLFAAMIAWILAKLAWFAQFSMFCWLLLFAVGWYWICFLFSLAEPIL